MAVSPNRSMVYVAGIRSVQPAYGPVYDTIAYNALTGSQLWDNQIYGFDNGGSPASVAVSPNGNEVFVTGNVQAQGLAGGSAAVTVAYGAASGATVWERRYVSPAKDNRAMSVAVSPDASTVYVTGGSFACASGYDYSTIAYNAATGAQSWIRRYSSPGDMSDIASEVVVSPTTGAVFVTGSSGGDLTTVAYSG